MTDESQKLELFELVEQICLRPELFVERSDFITICTFIDAFAHGRGGQFSQHLGQFKYWLAEDAYQKYGHPHNYGFSEYVRLLYPDDSDAIRALPELLREFQQHQQSLKELEKELT